MNRLVVFDVDGTLACTSTVDDKCWQQAALEVLGIQGISTDWGSYEHSTDEAIATELIHTHTDFFDVVGKVREVRDRFRDLILAAGKNDSNLFTPMPGAPEIFSHLSSAGWQSAIATGGWELTARYKLSRAGVRHEDVPAAFANDAHARSEIIRLAQRRAEELHGQPFDVVVYVGDGVWDVRAASTLKIGFIGCAVPPRSKKLQEAGAGCVVPDFKNTELFLQALNTVS